MRGSAGHITLPIRQKTGKENYVVSPGQFDEARKKNSSRDIENGIYVCICQGCADPPSSKYVEASRIRILLKI